MCATEGTPNRCPTCNRIIDEREIGLYKGMVKALWRVYNWCQKNGRRHFTRKDIKHLFTSENDTARFGDWVMFGPMIYKYRKAYYGLDFARCRDFFQGHSAIPKRVWKNPVTGAITKYEKDFRTIHQIPGLIEMMNEEKEYMARYRPVGQQELFSGDKR